MSAALPEGTVQSGKAVPGNSTEPRPFLLAGEWESSDQILEVSCSAEPNVPIGATYKATAEQYERAADAAASAREACASLASFERSRILHEVARGINERREELARLVALEAGKPVKDSLVEVDRAAMTVRLGAEEAERLYGEAIPLDLNERSRGRIALTRHVPIGPVAAIAPFNLPLGLTAHKLAPAFATGCPIVLKPASSTPLSILEVAEMFVAAGAPRGSISVMPMDTSVGDRLVEDDRFSLLTFTGSAEVGWSMKARSGRKPAVLELGGNAAMIVTGDADVEQAAQRCAYGAFKHAGQLCIAVQRAYVQSSVADHFYERLAEITSQLRVGHPLDPDSDIGPMISPSAARNASTLIREAVSEGADALLGGTEPDGAMLAPTILSDVPRTSRANREEAFAPLVTLSDFDELDEAISLVNDSDFGLQAGIFTNRLEEATRAFNTLEVGALVVNDAPTYRIDNMPYGGVKDSGLGREGLRWSIEDMTELRTMIVPGFA